MKYWFYIDYVFCVYLLPRFRLSKSKLVFSKTLIVQKIGTLGHFSIIGIKTFNNQLQHWNIYAATQIFDKIDFIFLFNSEDVIK